MCNGRVPADDRQHAQILVGEVFGCLAPDHPNDIIGRGASLLERDLGDLRQHLPLDLQVGEITHDETASPERRDALSAVYRRLDQACGDLRDAVGRDVLCIVMSDHGMGGASDKVVHLNRYLAEQGLLVRRAGIGRRQQERHV